MIRLKQIFREKRFQTKILIMGIACSLAAVVFTALGMYVLTLRASDSLSRELISEITSQISLNIDNRVNQIQSLLVNITMDQTVLDIISNQNEKGTQFDSEDSVILQKKMMQTQLIDRDINGLYIFDENGTAFYSALSPTLKRDYRLQDELWYPSMERVRGIKMLGRSTPNRYLMDKTQVVTMIQRYENLNNHSTLATIMVDIKLDMFRSIMQSMALSSDYCILILDEQNELIYSNYGTNIENTDALDLYNAVLSRQQEGKQAMIDSITDSLFWVSTTSSKTGWKVVCGAKLDQISGLSAMMKPLTAILVITVGLITAIGLSMITARQFRTLNILRSGMNTVKCGNFNFHIPVDAKDEIGELSNSFNEMTDQLNNLLNTVAQLEYEKHEAKLMLARAELEALQAQINPHFIYNTLETISMMAEINNDSDAQQMAASLGKLMRISVKGNNLISLKEELDYIENYLLIQRIRFDDSFRVEINIDQSLLNYTVPKLILQPIVENCINHGLEKTNVGGLIKVMAKKDGMTLEISVSDNGIGISEEELEKLQKAMEECSRSYYCNDGLQHIGLTNVNQRIRLRFPGKNYGLFVKSRLGEGTTIIVRLPADVKISEE